MITPKNKISGWVHKQVRKAPQSPHRCPPELTVRRENTIFLTGTECRLPTRKNTYWTQSGVQIYTKDRRQCAVRVFERQFSNKSAGGWVHVMRWEGFRESSLVEIARNGTKASGSTTTSTWPSRIHQSPIEPSLTGAAADLSKRSHMSLSTRLG